MALASNEYLGGGHVRSTSDNSIVVTTSNVGTYKSGGFLRDPDGRLVVVIK